MLFPRKTFDPVLSPVKLGLLLFENQLSCGQKFLSENSKQQVKFHFGDQKWVLHHYYKIRLSFLFGKQGWRLTELRTIPFGVDSDHTCQRSPARTSLICALETIPTGRSEPRLHTRRMSSSLEEKPPFSPKYKWFKKGLKLCEFSKNHILTNAQCREQRIYLLYHSTEKYPSTSFKTTAATNQFESSPM